MKAYFYTLVVIIFTTFSLSAQTIWLGSTDSDWQNPNNWSAGIPTPGMTITVPGNPQGGNFPVFSGGPVIDYTIQNAGTITFNTLVYNNGTIINFGGGIIMIDGQFFNAGAGTFDNDGILNVNAEFTNYGTFDTALSGEVNVANGATYTHAGLFFKAAGPFINNGSVVNTSNMRCTNVFENFGSLSNQNSFEAPFGSIFNNHASGSIDNPAGSIFVINGQFQNDSPVNNQGEFQLQSATIGTNTSTISNDLDFDISGSLINEGTIQNNSTIRIKDGGTLTNNNLVNNNGLITLAICGTLVQNAGNTISAPVENDGLIFLINGDVQWTNIEFGNEFTDINETKPPVAGCLAGVFVNLDANGEAVVQASQVDKGSYGSCGAALTSVTIDKTNFTTADLGANLVTLTVVDNIGVSSSCQSIVTILPYVAPINPIDDADIDFNCPDDITVTTLPGARTAAANWTEPTDATSTCAGVNECVTRTASNTTQCNSGDNYGFYLKLSGIHYYYAISNGVLTEYEDGTASYTAHLTNNNNNNYQFDLSIDLGGRTFTTPAGSPKANDCAGSTNDADWYYYTTTVGTLSGTNGFDGAEISIDRFGEAFQLGNGANATDGTNQFGASGWLSAQILSQPNNGPNLSINYGSNPQAADINIMLSGDGNECRPVEQCSQVDNIPGFIFLGEYNDSKYYCSNTNDYTWAAGKALAEANGGHLAIADDAAENTFIQNNILADWAWLGLTDEANEGTFVTIFGNTPSYFNWNAGEPNNGGGTENYVRILKSNGKWTDRDAHFQAEVIMEIPCSNGAPSCVNIPDSKPGFTFLGEYNNAKYYLSDHASDWNAAQANCAANGGNLVTIGDQNENDFIQTNINPSSGSIWTGLNTVSSPGNFQWANGEALGYTNWVAGEPNGNGINYGARMVQSHGRWTDKPTSSQYEYVLEISCATGNGGGPTGPPTIAQIRGPQNGDDFAVGITEVAYEVTDDCGNQEICIFEVTVDQTPSEITYDNCPGDITINSEPGATSAIVSWTPVTASTDCYNDGIEVEQALGPQIGDVQRAKDGAQLVVYQAIDSCGNFATCAFNVTVLATPSQITIAGCPGDINEAPTAGATDAVVTWNAPTGTTNCFTGVVNVTQLEGPASGSTFTQGTTTRIIYLIADECGNTEICIFYVTVDSCPDAGTACDDGDASTINDVEDGFCNCAGVPATLTINCSNNLIRNSIPGNSGVIVDFAVPQTTSDCSGNVTIQQTAGLGSGEEFPIGITTISFEVSDECGNIETCSFTITILQSSSTLTIECPDDITVQTAPGETTAQAFWGTSVVNTDCLNNLVIVNPSLGSGFNFPIGITTVTLIATDQCGSADTCSFTVTVVSVCIDLDGDGVCAADDCDDNDAALPAAAGTACDDGDATTENDVIGADGCSCAGTTIDPCAASGGDADGDGVCAADDCDDNDANLPAAEGTACDDGDATTENDVIGADGCSCAGTPIPCPAAGTPCDDGDFTTNHDEEDGNCNCVGIPSSITVSDCSADLVFQAAQGATGAIATFQSPGFSTNCSTGASGNVQQTLGGPSGTIYNIGVTTVEFTYADYCGNGASCSFEVTVLPFSCPTDMDGDGICAADDCDDNDANLPAAAGTACDDGDATTENDVIGADGCSCAGTTIDPCAANGGDADGDGVCAADDCDDNDANLPAAEGTTCDDGDATTENDVIGADGCSCAGTPISTDPDCADIVITPGVGNITISGLNAPVTSIQVFDANWNQEFKCFADCEDVMQVIDGLAEGTYFVKVAFYTASYQLICAVEDYYEVAGGDPCAANGGDADGDGVCAADDCDDNDASLPAAPGTSCDDGDADTVNDVIGADGCSCAGAPIGDPCAATGGDADGDGVCAADDCDDNDASLPAPAGTSCDDGDANTSNDEIQGDGCTCAGTPVGPDCGNIIITTGDGFILVDGLDGAPISSVQIFNSSWDREFKCAGDCNASEVVSDLAAGTYFVKVAFYTATWQPICEMEDYYVVTVGGGGDPCAALGGDADGDGVCAANDCDDNDANFPAPVGSACDDGNADTENDVILADGCTCEGTPPTSGPDCGLITIAPGLESLTISGLENAPITSIQVFDPQWNEVFKCAGDCEPMVQEVTGLVNNAIYFVKVTFYDASWNKVCAIEDFYKIETEFTDDPSNRRILEFQATKGARQVDLLWGSNTGHLNDYFEIQRSANGKDYETLLIVENKFELQGFQTYGEVDTQPLNGENFYRMKQVHDDGTYVYTGERKVVFVDDFNQFTLFPNPTSDQVYIHLKSFSGLAVDIEFYDALGRIVHVRSMRSAPEVPLPFDVSEFHEGTYMVSVKYKGKKRVTQRMVIIKD